MITLATATLATCIALGGGADQIRVRDLLPGFPGLQAAALDTPVGLAPSPGVPRIFRMPELLRLAARLNVTAIPEHEFCVAVAAAVLQPVRLIEAMQARLPDAHIEILDYTRAAVPDGPLEFHLSGLRKTPAGGFWYGAARYGGNRRFIVWAKVKVTALSPRVVATEELHAGRAVEASQVRLEMREEFPTADSFTASLEEIAGRVLKRSVPQGAALRTEWLCPARDVTRGDAVRVDVWNGGTHLEFEGEAQASGSTGETIPVLNPVSRKRFLAKVAGKGKVAVGEGDQ